MNFRLEVGKWYAMADGRRIYIFHEDGDSDCLSMHGAENDEAWNPMIDACGYWNRDGSWSGGNHYSALVAEAPTPEEGKEDG